MLFPPLAIMSNASMNICVQVIVWTYVFIFLEYIPRSGILSHVGLRLIS